VADIFELSRRRNAGLGIQGLLLFDGEAFAQLLHGEAAVLRPLVDAIRADRRHTAFACLIDDDGALDERSQGGWRAGFAPPGALEALYGGIQPLQALDLLLPSCDLV
jgi:hypothetical protein